MFSILWICKTSVVVEACTNSFFSTYFSVYGLHLLPIDLLRSQPREDLWLFSWSVVWLGGSQPQQAITALRAVQGVSKDEWLVQVELVLGFKGEMLPEVLLVRVRRVPLPTVTLLQKRSLGILQCCPRSSGHPLLIEMKVCPWLVPPAQAIFWFLVTVSSVVLSFSRYMACN